MLVHGGKRCTLTWEFLDRYHEKDFSVRIVKLCNGLPREVVESPSLENFNTEHDIAQSTLV